MRVRAHRSKRGAAPNPEDEASYYGVGPPRVLVVSPESSGKTTACRILTNYAVRGPTPAFPPIANWTWVMYIRRLPGFPPLMRNAQGAGLCMCS